MKIKPYTFKRHFRIYFKNNHPAYIVDEEGNMYVFHRVTHSKTSGNRNNWKMNKNPIFGHEEPMYIVKQEQKDSKSRFSVFEIELKKGVDVSYPDIKKAGSLQTDKGRTRYESSTNIKSKQKLKNNKKIKK
jgi:hypothetical protein